MSESNVSNIWKIRIVKNYPEAHNHILVGRLLNSTESYVRLDCISMHFGKSVNSLKDIKMGQRDIRLLPWSRIELINELPSSFDFSSANLQITKQNAIALGDQFFSCVITSSYDVKY